MSINYITKTKEDMSKSPINSSKSKQLYTFPKSERFPKPKLDS